MNLLHDNTIIAPVSFVCTPLISDVDNVHYSQRSSMNYILTVALGKYHIIIIKIKIE